MMPLLLTIATLAQPPVRYLPLPHELVQRAATDLQSLPIEDQPHQQYFSFREPNCEYRRAFNVTLNLAVNRGSLQLRATPVGRYLVRIDKRQWLPRQNRAERALSLTPPRENFDRILNEYADPFYTVDTNDDQVDVIVTVEPVPLKSSPACARTDPSRPTSDDHSHADSEGRQVAQVHARRQGGLRAGV